MWQTSGKSPKNKRSRRMWPADTISLISTKRERVTTPHWALHNTKTIIYLITSARPTDTTQFRDQKVRHFTKLLPSRRFRLSRWLPAFCTQKPTSQSQAEKDSPAESVIPKIQQQKLREFILTIVGNPSTANTAFYPAQNPTSHNIKRLRLEMAKSSLKLNKLSFKLSLASEKWQILSQ